VPISVARIATLLTVVVLALAPVATACTSGGNKPTTENLPGGADLLGRATQAMASVDTAHFSLRTEGTVQGVAVHSADGRITRSGAADGSAKVDQQGQLVEVQFVIVNNSLYLKGPTGGYQRLPAMLAGSVYDPSAILNPDRGVAKVLSTARDPQTEARERIGGTDTYRIRVTLDPQVVSVLVPGVTTAVTGQVWLDAAQSRLVQARVPMSGGAVIITLSDWGAPTTITPPAG
jgi:lipoprotein LprG